MSIMRVVSERLRENKHETQPKARTTTIGVLGGGLLNAVDIQDLKTAFGVTATRVITPNVKKQDGPFWVFNIEDRDINKFKIFVSELKKARVATRKLGL